MDETRRERFRTNPLLRMARWTIPWVALAVVVWLLAGAWGEFKQAQKLAAIRSAAQQSSIASASVAATATALTGRSAVVVIDGVRLRGSASASADVIATVGKSTRLLILAQSPGWLRVKDPQGHIGWVTDSAQFVKIADK
jgi:hypothetical protein